MMNLQPMRWSATNPFLDMNSAKSSIGNSVACPRFFSLHVSLNQSLMTCSFSEKFDSLSTNGGVLVLGAMF